MVHFDISELLANPVRTGIQRVVRELLRRWPNRNTLALCSFDYEREALLTLPHKVLSLLVEENPRIREKPVDEVRRMLGEIVVGVERKRVTLGIDKVVVPELFFSSERTRLYRKHLNQDPYCAHFLLYDFIPWLHPGTLQILDCNGLMRYISVVQKARLTGYISQQTRDEYWNRILRRPHEASGPVFGLGADGFGLETQRFSRNRRLFVCLGSVDRRRNQVNVVRAFQRLWADGADCQLAIVGAIFDPTAHAAQFIRNAAETEPRLQLKTEASDAEVRQLMRKARATISAATIEGFGLPPVESLHAGVPVIVTSNVPSISMLSPHGQIRIGAPDVNEIERAVRLMLDDSAAEQLWSDAALARLDTWDDFAQAVADWVLH